MTSEKISLNQAQDEHYNDMEQGEISEPKINQVRLNFKRVFIGLALALMVVTSYVSFCCEGELHGFTKGESSLNPKIALTDFMNDDLFITEHDPAIRVKVVMGMANDFENMDLEARSELEGGSEQESKREDENKDDTKKTESQAKKILNEPGIKAVLVVGAFIILNVLVILIHHIIQKLSNTDKFYRNVEQHISPF